MLGTYRVLDLTDDRGQLAGSMLAALGAEVILVEPPGGSASRRDALAHWSHNRGKQSVVLDLEGSEDDRRALRGLAEGADVLIESSQPGAMARLGLGDEDLRALNPALVYVSITSFGLDGPKAHWAATDLTVWASSMSLVLTGDDDRPPLRMSLPQSFLHASADAACGALLALAERERSGLGQHVDVSAQQSCLQATQSMVLAAPLKSSVPTRLAEGARIGPLRVQTSWPCKDGHVAITLLFGTAIGPATRRFMDWMHEEGFCDEATRDKNWIDYALLLLTGQEPVEEYERVKQAVGAFTLTKTKAELLDGALERRLLVAPVTTIAEVCASEQLASRDYWDEVGDETVSDRPIRCPGPFAKPSRTPLPALGRAPRLGEHIPAVRAAAMALEDGSDPNRLDQDGGSALRASPPYPPALEGVKVLDLMWVMAGPAITRVLADFGATVVRVESATRIETARTINPFYEDVPDPERSGLFWNLNVGKLGLGLNLAKPGAREVLHDLVRWADVVCESFSPRAMRAWGLDYERLREVNPSMVMLSSCLMGQTGPLAEFAGYGNLAASIAGFFNVAGWPDRAPCGPFGAYTDYVSPRYGLAVLLAALDDRRRTGDGQYIDLSQAEAAINFLAPAIVDYTVNGRVLQRSGNDDPFMSPHGVYACAGEDRWVAIACETDGQREALAALLDGEELELWTSKRSPDEAAECCQGAGVPAHAVQSSAECAADPQLVHRGHFVEVDHERFGPVTVEGSRMRLSRTPARVERAAPTIGQDTVHVLTEILGYDEEKVGDLFAAEILE